MQRVKIIENTYNQNDIFEILDKLQILKSGDYVLTYFDGQLIADSKVTEKYEVFDFPKFAKIIVKEINNYFSPETYKLRISKGKQELRLIGEEVIINGEKYNKMFNILNSTDKSRALQLNIGLIRLICINGMVVAVDDEYSGLKTKHFKTTMPERVDRFIESLKKFNILIDKQSERIEKLQGRFISFRELMEKIAIDENGFYNEAKDAKIRAFGKKLLTSQTDRLLELNSEQVSLLKNPRLFLNPEYRKVDIEMPAYQAVNCWMEVYRNYDSSILKRETNRILELV